MRLISPGEREHGQRGGCPGHAVLLHRQQPGALLTMSPTVPQKVRPVTSDEFTNCCDLKVISFTFYNYLKNFPVLHTVPTFVLPLHHETCFSVQLEQSHQTLQSPQPRWRPERAFSLTALATIQNSDHAVG